MLAEIHTAIQQMLFEKGRIPRNDVDVTFDMPTKEWIASRTRPTINFFLFDIAENNELRTTNMQTTRSNGHALQRMPPRRFDLRYSVSALTTMIEDEHLLIWRTLATLLKYSSLPEEELPEVLRLLEVPLVTKVERTHEGPHPLELWSALEVPPHPTLLYVVSAPLDLEIAFETPLVLTRTIRTVRRGVDIVETSTRIGGVVRSADGTPVAGVVVGVEGRVVGSITNDEGRFKLSNVPHGTLKLQIGLDGSVLKSATIEIPSDSYDITLD
jgi:hypothetical protein